MNDPVNFTDPLGLRLDNGCIGNAPATYNKQFEIVITCMRWTPDFAWIDVGFGRADSGEIGGGGGGGGGGPGSKSEGAPQKGQCPAVPSPGPGKEELDEAIKDAQWDFANRSRWRSAWNFFQSVKPGGDWDWKESIPGSAEYGNFAYGATGRAYGYSLAKLEGMATVVQAYDDVRHLQFDGFGDNAGDPGAIAAGSKYFEMGCWR